MTATRWPGERPATAGPTACTVPANSWPRTSGSGQGRRPAATYRSVRQTPATATRITTSSGARTIGTGTDRTATDNPHFTIAHIVSIAVNSYTSGMLGRPIWSQPGRLVRLADQANTFVLDRSQQGVQLFRRHGFVRQFLVQHLVSQVSQPFPQAEQFPHPIIR